jgi:hypothetical protein
MNRSRTGECAADEIRRKQNADDLFSAILQTLRQLADPGRHIREGLRSIAFEYKEFTVTQGSARRDFVQRPDFITTQRRTKTPASHGAVAAGAWLNIGARGNWHSLLQDLLWESLFILNLQDINRKPMRHFHRYDRGRGDIFCIALSGRARAREVTVVKVDY